MARESTVPGLEELFARYLSQQADACASGLAVAPDEVTPYETGPVQPIDPKLAWDEGLAVFALAEPAISTRAWQAAPSWPGLVAGHEPVVALALAAGNFPQLVRNFHLLAQATDLTKLRPQPRRPSGTPELLHWVEQTTQFPQRVLALGVLRLAGQFAEAQALVAKHDATVPAAWRTLWDNEQAALAWHAGRPDAAVALWERQAPTPAVLFNRGMARLFLGDAVAGRTHLSAAVARLPEASAWHHLTQLYLTLAGR